VTDDPAFAARPLPQDGLPTGRPRQRSGGRVGIGRVDSRFARLEVRTFPSEDDAFAAVVDESLRDTAPTTPAQLEARLAPTFPDVAVHERAAVAVVDVANEPTVWYVFRDGRLRQDGGAGG
jgi:hypothetical protein